MYLDAYLILCLSPNLKAKKAPRKLPACFQQGMGESGLQELKFHGKVYYCSQKDDCNFICNQMRYD